MSVSLLEIPVVSMSSKGGATPEAPVGIWIAKLMSLRGLNQTQLADAADLTQVYVSGLLRGIRNPSKDAIRNLARGALGNDADEHVLDALIDEGLIAAGFAPEGNSYKVVHVSEQAPDEHEASSAINRLVSEVQALQERFSSDTSGLIDQVAHEAGFDNMAGHWTPEQLKKLKQGLMDVVREILEEEG